MWLKRWKINRRLIESLLHSVANDDVVMIGDKTNVLSESVMGLLSQIEKSFEKFGNDVNSKFT